MTETSAPTTATLDAAPSRGTHLATLGLLMAAAGPLLLLAGTLLWGLTGDDGAFFGVTAALGLAGAALISRRRTALKIIGIVLAVVVAGALFWTAFGLAEPASFLDFVPGLLVLPGVLLAIVAGIISVRSAKRGRPVERGEDRTVMAILGVLGVLAVVSLALTASGRETVDADLAAEADLTVELEDFEFDQAGYDVQGGDTILIKNDDPFVHTFTVEALDIDVDLGPLSEELVTIPEEPGTYVLYCEPHTSDTDDPGEDDMSAELQVG